MISTGRLLAVLRIFLVFALFGFGQSVLGQGVAPQTGWWWNPGESGRGFAIEEQNGVLFFAGFLYDSSGRATWYVTDLVPAADSSGNFVSSLTSYSGGQTLSGSYRPISGVADSGKMLTLSFSSPTEGMLTWPGGSVPIQRFPIVTDGLSATPPANGPQTGWWWNADQSGRGFFVEIQNNTMFTAGFMYDDAGSPIWYLTKGQMSGANSYRGLWSQFGNGQTISGSYKMPVVTNANVGAVALDFGSPTSATLTLPTGETVALTRYAYSGLVAGAAKPLNAGMVSVTPGKIDLKAVIYNAATASLGVTVSDLSAANVYVQLTPDRPDIFSTTIPVTQTGKGSASVQITTLRNLAVGQYSGSIAVHACKDATCAAEYSGSPISVPYTYTVGPLHAVAVFLPSVLTASVKVGVPTSLNVSAHFREITPGMPNMLSYTVVDSNGRSFTPNPESYISTPTLVFSLAPVTFTTPGTVTGTLTFNFKDVFSDSYVKGAPAALPYSITVIGDGDNGGSSTQTYTVGGTITGLGNNAGLVLVNNGGDATVINPNASIFAMKTGLASGSTYAIAVQTQPTGVTCTVANGSGTVSVRVTNVAVSCVPNSGWAWVAGTRNPNDWGHYGSLGIAASANAPWGRAYPMSWKDRQGTLWLFGGWNQDVGHFNDMWAFNPQTLQWAWMGGASTTNAAGSYGTKGQASASNIPPARAAGATWVDAVGYLWLFGGEGASANLNDLWRFNPQTGLWTWISGATTGLAPSVHGASGVEDPSYTPGARSGAVTWVDGAGHLWLFGGNAYNDLWRFNPQTGFWAWMSGSDTNAAPATFGTLGQAAVGNIPAGRAHAIAWTDMAGNFWLYGGTTVYANSSVGGAGVLSDVWKYNPQTGLWTWASGSNSVSTLLDGPKLGWWNCPANWGDQQGGLVIFAADGAVGNLSSLWHYDTQSRQWSGGTGLWDGFGYYGVLGQSGPGFAPSVRSGPAIWTDDSGTIWVFGGYGHVGLNEGNMNDLWRYRP